MYVNHRFFIIIRSSNHRDHNGNYLIPYIGVINNLKKEINNNDKNDSNDNNNDKNDKNDNND